MLLAGVFLPVAMENTVASWGDKQSGRAEVSALTVPGVPSTACEGVPGGLLYAATATLSWPSVSAPPGVNVSYLVKATNSKGQTQVFSQPETSRLFKLGLLDTLLGVLLSSPTTLTLEVRTVFSFPSGATWSSPVAPPTRHIEYMGSLLGLTGGFKCL